MKNNYICIIPARKGSKTLKNKNTKLFKRKPLISWVIEKAIKLSSVDKIIVTSDDPEILKLNKKYNSNKIVFNKRPRKLSQDNSKIYEVIKYLHKYYKLKNPNFILLQPTSPLTRLIDIKKSIKKYEKFNSKFLVSVTRNSKTPELLFKINNSSKLIRNKTLKTTNRQLYRKYYEVNGSIYIANFSAYLQKKSFITGNTHTYEMDKKNSIDIDDILDFKIAELLMGVK